MFLLWLKSFSDEDENDDSDEIDHMIDENTVDDDLLLDEKEESVVVVSEPVVDAVPAAVKPFGDSNASYFENNDLDEDLLLPVTPIPLAAEALEKKNNLRPIMVIIVDSAIIDGEVCIIRKEKQSDRKRDAM